MLLVQPASSTVMQWAPREEAGPDSLLVPRPNPSQSQPEKRSDLRPLLAQYLARTNFPEPLATESQWTYLREAA